MSLSAAVIDAMIDAGCTAEQLGAAMKADLAEQQTRREAKRANNAERQRRFKANQKAGNAGNAGNALPSVTPSPKVPPNDIYSNPPPSPQPDSQCLSNDKHAPLPEKQVLDHWNAMAGPGKLKSARPLNADRKAKLKRRVEEFGLEALLTAISNIAASPFHCGEGSRGWQADIGWFLKSNENVTKSLETLPDPGGGRKPQSNGSESANYFEYLKSQKPQQRESHQTQ